MRVSRSIYLFRLLLSVALLALCSYRVEARNATSPTSIVESKLGGATILNAPADKLISTVQDCVKENPLRAGRIVQAVLGSGRADADAIAPQVAASAIMGLGKAPASTSVSDIISFTVKATPAVVLETVKATVRVAPGSAKVIVRAAVKAIPNPNDKIQPIGEKLSDQGYSKDDPETDGKDQPEADPATSQDPLPIGEAIAKAAQAGDPSLSYQDLLNTANQAAQESRSGGFTNASTYQGYYYPPLLAGVPNPSPTPAAMPSPPVVSR